MVDLGQSWSSDGRGLDEAELMALERFSLDGRPVSLEKTLEATPSHRRLDDVEDLVAYAEKEQQA